MTVGGMTPHNIFNQRRDPGAMRGLGAMCWSGHDVMHYVFITTLYPDFVS